MGSSIKQLSLPYSHAWDNFYKGIDHGGPYYRCSFYFPDWSQSDAIANQIMGYNVRYGTPGATGLSFNVAAMNHPLSPNLYAVKCDIEGVGSPQLNRFNGLPYYNSGFLAHVEFRPWVSPSQLTEAQNQAIDPSTPILWCIQALDFHADRVANPLARLYFSNGDRVPDQSAFSVVHVTVMSLTFPRLPYIPTYWITKLQDCVNQSTFLGQDPGTVKFDGGRTARQWNTDGSVVQSVELVFEWRSIPWNKLPKTGFAPGNWDTVADGNGQPFYKVADLSPLIQL